MQKRNRLSKRDLRALNVSPGLLSTRYLPGQNRAEIRRLTSDPSFASRRDFVRRLTSKSKPSEEER